MWLQTVSELEKRGQEQLGFWSRSPKSSSELLVVGEVGLPHSVAALGQRASCRGVQDSGTSVPAHKGK